MKPITSTIDEIRSNLFDVLKESGVRSGDGTEVWLKESLYDRIYQAQGAEQPETPQMCGCSVKFYHGSSEDLIAFKTPSGRILGAILVTG